MLRHYNERKAAWFARDCAAGLHGYGTLDRNARSWRLDYRSSPESSLAWTGVRKWSTTKSATWRPSRWPVVRSERKCTPAKIRLKVASSAAAEKLVKERWTFGKTSEVTVKSK